MSARGLLTVRRVTTVDEALAAELDVMFDEGVSWDAEQGQRFLAHPDTLLLVARWDGEACGFLSAYRLQRFDRRGAEVLLYEIGVEEPFQRQGRWPRARRGSEAVGGRAGSRRALGADGGRQRPGPGALRGNGRPRGDRLDDVRLWSGTVTPRE